MLKRLDNTNKMTHELYIKNTLTVIIKYIVSKQKTLRKKDKNQNTRGGTPIHYLYGYVPPNGVVILKLLI